MIEGFGKIKVQRDANGRILISKEPGEPAVPITVPASQQDFTGLGFWSYAITDPAPAVVVAPGALRVTLPSAGGGIFGEVDSAGGGVMAEQVFTNLTPGSSGYLVFRYGQITEGIPASSTASQYGVDFGDPSGTYFVSGEIGTETTGTEASNVNGNRYGIVFLEEPPEASNQYFQQILCRIQVNQAGIPSVQPVHFGDLLVPLGYIGTISNFTASLVG